MDPQPLPRQRALTAIEGALALIAVLLVVQMWLLTATLESVLAGHADAAVPAAALSTLLFGACAALYLFVARIDGRIVGSLTLVLFRLPTGMRAWIEDVVVDDTARGHGVGAAINRTALAEAAARGARTVSTYDHKEYGLNTPVPRIPPNQLSIMVLIFPKFDIK